MANSAISIILILIACSIKISAIIDMRTLYYELDNPVFTEEYISQSIGNVVYTYNM